MIYFVKRTKNRETLINHDRIQNKIALKHHFKNFYICTNNKDYESQIFKHNICHKNGITIQNAILIVKIVNKSAKKRVYY